MSRTRARQPLPWAAWLPIMVASGCVASQSVSCPDGIVCPHAQVCSPLGGCVVPEQLASCSPMPTDGLCTLPDGSTGGCFSGVCLPTGCGNGIVEPGERCDDGNTAAGDGCSATCDSDERCGNGLLDVDKSEGCDCGDASLPDSERPPACDGQANSDVPGARCTQACQIVGCGDGVVGGLEACDGADLNDRQCTDIGFYAGTLACKSSCLFDDAGCSGRCGDGQLDALHEDCDATQLGGADCATFGFYDPAGLQCNAICGFDTSACTGYCGDNQFDPNGHEACDPVESASDLASRGWDCTDFGYHAAAGLACGSSCQFDTSACTGGYCGDGVVNGGEECDLVASGGATCATFGYYNGTLGCRDDCTYDLTTCSGRCGDGIIDTGHGEQCDGATMPPSTDCTTFDYYGGVLGCTQACSFDTGACTGSCGDGVLDSVRGEQCDQSAFTAGASCGSFGFYAGSLLCTSGCTYDISQCSGSCGDGTVQLAAGEDCEVGVPITGADCTSFDFYAGTLACSDACQFDLGGCSLECGDGLVNGTETCDTAPPADFACRDVGASGGLVGCSRSCDESRTHCYTIGFQPESTGAAATLRDAWGVGDELFAAGTAILHTKGGAWSTQAARDTDGIWGTAVTNVLAVGATSSGAWGIYRFNGTSWSPMTAPGTAVALHDIHGLTATDAWAVGDAGNVLQLTGAGWVSRKASGANLRGVWTVAITGTTHAFAVGDGGTVYNCTSSSCTTETVTSPPGSFKGVWGRSATEIYAVGDNGKIYMRSGTTWAQPNAQWQCGTSATGIGGLAGPYVAVVVGTSGSVGYACQLGGGTWHSVSLPSSGSLYGIGGSESKLALVGDSTIETSKGAAWVTTIGPTPLLKTTALWGSSASNLFAVGNRDSGTGLFYEGIAHWNGSAWSSQLATTVQVDLQAIYGGTGWAVAAGGGSRILSSDGAGGAWTVQTVSSGAPPPQLSGVWGDASFVYITGGDGSGVGGAILRRPTTGFVGTAVWTVLTSATLGTNADLSAIWGVPGGAVFAVGSGGTILRNVGGTWSTMSSGTSATLTAVWGRSASDVYAAGGGVILHYDGVSWARMATTEDIKPGDLAGNAVDVFTGGAFAFVLDQRIGGRWLPMERPTSSFQTSAMFSLGDVTLFAGNQAFGALIGRTWSPTATETACSDTWDDDNDGRIDCADSDCAAAAACAGSGACRPAQVVACGSPAVSASTLGGAMRYPAYGQGCSTRDESGSEAYFIVHRPTVGNITVTVSGSTQDLDLIVASATGGGACTPEEKCLAAAQTSSVNPSVTITGATANTDYVVIVDGFAGAAGNFMLQVTCP